MTEEDNADPRSRPRLRRILGAGLVIALLVAGGTAYYLHRLDTKARTVYQLGSTLNVFLGEYASDIKRRNVDAVLAHYHRRYSDKDDSIADWSEELIWTDSPAAGDGVQVYRWEESGHRPFSRDNLRGRIENLIGGMDYVNRAKFKIEAIEENDGLEQATLKALLWLRGTDESGDRVETHAWFRLRLANSDGWKLLGMELLDGVTVRGRGTGFADVTADSGIDFEAVHNPMFRKEEWRPDMFEIMHFAHGGVSVADVDGDGWEDIFFGDGKSPRLFRNRGDGTFHDFTAEAGLPEVLEGVHVALFADFDNDGDPDLFIGRSTGGPRLYRNKGEGSFVDATDSANLGNAPWVATAAAADYDNDGLIDLYLGRYLDPRVNLPDTLFYTRNSEGNSLLRNEGDLTFTDVTAEAGVREGGLTLGTCWGDYDRDGDLDLYVANDFGRNALLRNEGNGTFADVSKESGAADIGYGMSSSFADLDNDSDLDIYVSNVHSSQRWFGNEATLKNYFATLVKQGSFRHDRALLDEVYDLVDGEWESLADRVMRGNSMFLNNADGTFSDVSEQNRVNPHGWYWSSVVFDYDNDGHQDIYAVNGWITGKEPDDL